MSTSRQYLHENGIWQGLQDLTRVIYEWRALQFVLWYTLLVSDPLMWNVTPFYLLAIRVWISG